jgi:hypothetical protein
VRRYDPARLGLQVGADSIAAVRKKVGSDIRIDPKASDAARHELLNLAKPGAVAG